MTAKVPVVNVTASDHHENVARNDEESSQGIDTGPSRVVTYGQPPPILKKSPLFRVFAGSPEQEVFTEVFDKRRTIHLAGFSASGSVPIRVEVLKPFSGSPQISPKSRKLQHTVDGNSIRFTITKPENLILIPWRRRRRPRGRRTSDTSRLDSTSTSAT
jgi:hypothetical protein